MRKPANLPYYFEWSQQFPHIAAVDLGQGMAHDIAVMAIDNRNGDLYFIRLDHLDSIDIKRLRQIILSRDSARYPLWDLMSQKTLPNGMNALEFFQQFVKGRSVSGQIFRPGEGARGISMPKSFAYEGPESSGFEAGEPAEAAATAETGEAQAAPKRKAGRPRKTA